jgi:hypothetical protein
MGEEVITTATRRFLAYQRAHNPGYLINLSEEAGSIREQGENDREDEQYDQGDDV